MSSLGLVPTLPWVQEDPGPEPLGKSAKPTSAEKSTSAASANTTSPPRDDEARKEAEPAALEANSPLQQALTDMLQSTRLKLRFNVDDETGRVVVQVLDSETDKVIRQIPPQEVLELATRLEKTRSVFFHSKV